MPEFGQKNSEAFGTVQRRVAFQNGYAPYFLYHKKNRNRKGKEEDPIEVVKKVLIDMKTLLES